MRQTTSRTIPLAGWLLALLLVTSCSTARQLSDVQPGMSMAAVRDLFGAADEMLASPVPARDGMPSEVTWYYNAYRPRRIFEWQTIPTQDPPGWRIEPGQTTVGVRYRRFEITFHDGVVVGRAEFEPPTW